jgi:hypothetical protein
VVAGGVAGASSAAVVTGSTGAGVAGVSATCSGVVGAASATRSRGVGILATINLRGRACGSGTEPVQLVAVVGVFTASWSNAASNRDAVLVRTLDVVSDLDEAASIGLRSNCACCSGSAQAIFSALWLAI